MIEEIIQNVFNSDTIKTIIDQMDDPQEKGDFLNRVVNYCIIMDSNEGMETFIQMDERAQTDYVREQIAKKINLENSKENEHEIFKYACEKLLTNGYAYHVTNSVAMKEIMTNGLTPDGGRYSNSDLRRIAKIYEKYGRTFVLGWANLDNENNQGWFYETALRNVEHYANSPEWFSQFCGESFEYLYGTIPEENKDAYKKRDYETALQNIQALIHKIGISAEEEKEILQFFNENWKKYVNSKPELLLIPREKLENQIDSEAVAQIYGMPYLNKLLSGKIFEGYNKSSKEKVMPDNIKIVDLSNFFGPDIQINHQEIEMEETREEKEKINHDSDISSEENEEVQSKTIAQYIEESLKMKNIQNRCYRRCGMKMSEEENAAKSLGQVINYCILFKSNEGIDEYISLVDDKSRKVFIKNKIAKLLSINPEDIESHQREIAQFILDNFEKGGYAFHTTNSLSADEIMRNGISKNKRFWTKDEILEIDEIFKKYGKSNIMGWITADMRNSDGWFYDFTPRNIEDYSGAPEWFAQFCGEAIYGYRLLKDENRSAFRHRNYEVALDNINKLIGTTNMDQSDKNKVLSFFNKYWKMFEDTKSNVIMIPNTKIAPNLLSKRIEDYTSDKIDLFSTDKKKEDYTYFIKKELEYIVELTDDINLKHRENIDAEGLQCIDISPVIERSSSRMSEKSEEELITMDRCIELIRGFDPSMIQQAYALLKDLQSQGLELNNNQEVE